MHEFTNKIFLIILLFGYSSVGSAEPSVESEQESLAVVQKSLGETTADNPSLVTNGIQISSSAGKSEASIQIAPVTGKYNFGITLTSPLSKSTNTATFYNEDAFTNSTSLKVNYQVVNFSKELESIHSIDVDNAYRACEAVPEAFGFKKDSGCFTVRVNDLVSNYDPTKDPDKKAASILKWESILDRPISFYGFTAGIGRSDQEYYDVGSTVKESVTNIPWSMGVYYTWALPKYLAITFKYDYQVGYKDQSSNIVCSPTPESDGLIHCVEGSIGAPSEKINSLASINFRIPFSIGSMNMAMSPTFTQNTQDNKFSMSVPIYFLQDSSKGLTGGLSMSWNESDEKWRYGIFVGSKFKIL